MRVPQNEFDKSSYRNRQYWYKAADIVYCLNEHNTSLQYYVMDSIDGDAVLQCVQAINSSVEIINRINQPIVIPINLNNNHWVSLVIVKEDNKLVALYADSLAIPINKRLTLVTVLLNYGIEIVDRSIEHQQTNGCDCGVYTVMNLHHLATNSQTELKNLTEDQITKEREKLIEVEQTAHFDIYNIKFRDRIKQFKEIQREFDKVINDLFSSGSSGSLFKVLGTSREYLVSHTDEHLIALNIISRLFSTDPYTSIIECRDQIISDYLYISLTDKATHIDNEMVKTLSSSINNVVNNITPQNKATLLIEMCIAQNPYLLATLKQKIREVTSNLQRLRSEIEDREDHIELVKRKNQGDPLINHREQSRLKNFDRDFEEKAVERLKIDLDHLYEFY